MSDSVGKITLDVELVSDLKKQVGAVSSLIGNNLRNSLQATTKAAFGGMDKSTKKSLNTVNNSIRSMLTRMRESTKNTLSSVFAAMKNIKMPKIKFPRVEVSKPKAIDQVSTKSYRGPPMNGEMLGAKIQNVSATLDTVNARIDQQQSKLAQLRESYSRTFNQSRKNKIEEQMLKTEAAINKLIGQSDKLGFELSDLDAQYAALGANVSKASGGTNKFSNSMKNLEKNTKRAGNSFRSSHSGLSMFLGTMIKWGVIFPIIQRGIMAMATSLGQSFMTNAQFANSLAQIKTNLSVAFTPIFNAILPALNALMSALATATTYIASFISAIFGKTYQQSYSATQSLINAKAAMGAYGDTTEKAGKQAKKAQGSLAGFDEINTLNMDNGSDDTGTSGGSGGGADIPTLTPPSIDTSAVDSSMKKLVDKIKGFISTIDFTPLKKSFENLKASIVPIVENIGKILSWFMTNILGPLTKWTIEDLLPAFFNLLAGVFKVLNPLLEVFMNVGKWLWDNFLQPIAAWTGGVIVNILNGLADVLTRIGQWISENKPLIEDLILVIGSFALAWGIVTIAMGAWNIVVGIWNAVGAIAIVVTTAFGAAVAFLTHPITLAIIIIGSLIAVGVLLYKHWDELKVKASQVWTSIQNAFAKFDNWITSVFKTDWSKNFGFLGDILNGFNRTVGHIWNAIKNIFGGVIDFVAGVFTGNWRRAFNGIYKIVSGVAEGVGVVFTAPINMIIGLVNAMISAINLAIRGLNKLSWKVPDWVPKIGGRTWGFSIPQIPKVPYLAKGGIIDSPTLAMVGEQGREAVVPLENNTGGLDLLASKLLERMPQSDNKGFGDGDLILQVDGSVIGRVALKQLRKMQRQGNITLIPT